MTAKRLVIDVDLTPLAGSTFQPTGFPDLGAATFKRPTGDGRVQECLLVESVQSMANRLEGTGWHEGAQRQVVEWEGLPYLEVRSKDTGEFLTSSRVEAHRIFSAFVRDAAWPDGARGDAVLVERLGLKADTPLNYRAMARAIVALDPLSLLHGVFFAGKPKAGNGRAGWPANPKFARAVTGVIEAHGIERVASGGRKADLVRHTVVEGGGTAEGYGSVPFHRVEFAAETIRASFVVDLALIASYGLPDPVSDLLATLALWEIRSLVDGGLRLRTACDLVPTSEVLAFRGGSPLPEQADLTDKLRALVEESAEHLGTRGPIPLTWSAKK